MGGGFATVTKNDNSKKTNATASNVGDQGGKHKPNGNKQKGGHKKPKREFSDKYLKMGLFHLKKGTTNAKALPDKSTLNDGVSVCLVFFPW